MNNLFDSAPGFDQPLAVLKHCHDRIRKQLATMDKLVVHLNDVGIDENAQQAAMLASAPIRSAYEELDLTPKATPQEVRAAYADLVRRFHPDSNGGDRSAEARLQAVVKAYKVLKTSKRA